MYPALLPQCIQYSMQCQNKIIKQNYYKPLVVVCSTVPRPSMLLCPAINIYINSTCLNLTRRLILHGNISLVMCVWCLVSYCPCLKAQSADTWLGIIVLLIVNCCKWSLQSLHTVSL